MLSTEFEGNDFSLVFIDTLNSLIIAYRDFFGKRSLLLTYNESTKEISFSSVNMHENLETVFEIPPATVLAFPFSKY